MNRRFDEITLPITDLCNLGCRYCRRAPILDDQAIEARLDAVTDPDRVIVVITGGEPALSPRLLPLLHRLVERGFAYLCIETNGLAAVYPGWLRRLERLGLALTLRVPLPHADFARYEHLARTPGLARLFPLALEHLLASTLTVRVRTLVSRDNLDELPEIAGFLADRKGVQAWELALLETEDPDEVPELPRLLDGVTAAMEAAFRRGQSVHTVNFPPCLAAALPNEGPKAPHTGGAGVAWTPIAACADCRAQIDCPGLPVGMALRWQRLGPAQLGLHRRALPLETDPERSRLVSPDSAQRPNARDGGGTVIFRTLWHCQQRCDFCWVDTAQAVSRETVEAEFHALLGSRPRELVFSGGEPTLDKRLEDFLTRAKASGIERTRIQSNACLIDRKRAQSLRQAGLDTAFIALLAHQAAQSDAITHDPGAFDKTLAGIGHLLDAGIFVILNHVICRQNAATLPEFARFVTERYRGCGLSLSFAHPISPRVDPREVSMPFSEVAPNLKAAMEIIWRTDMMERLQLLGECGFPPCVLDGDERFFPCVRPVEQADPVSFFHPPLCQGCTWRPACVGVRKRHYWHFGDAGLKTLETPVPWMREFDPRSRIPKPAPPVIAP